MTDKQIEQLRTLMQNKSHVFCISGVQGPTGKSTLTKILNTLGYKAYEAYEVVPLDLSHIQENINPKLLEELLAHQDEIKDWINVETKRGSPVAGRSHKGIKFNDDFEKL